MNVQLASSEVDKDHDRIVHISTDGVVRRIWVQLFSRDLSGDGPWRSHPRAMTGDERTVAWVGPGVAIAGPIG